MGFIRRDEDSTAERKDNVGQDVGHEWCWNVFFNYNARKVSTYLKDNTIL